jgi:hypothetical protein
MRPNSPEVILLMLESLKKAGIHYEKLSPAAVVSLCHPEDLEDTEDF